MKVILPWEAQGSIPHAAITSCGQAWTTVPTSLSLCLLICKVGGEFSVTWDPEAQFFCLASFSWRFCHGVPLLTNHTHVRASLTFFLSSETSWGVLNGQMPECHH